MIPDDYVQPTPVQEQDPEKDALRLLLKDQLKVGGLSINTHDLDEMADKLSEATTMSKPDAFGFLEEIYGEALVEIFEDAKQGRFGGH